MRKRRSVPPLAIIAGILLLLVNIPGAVAENLQSTTVSIVSPFWRFFSLFSWDALSGRSSLLQKIDQLEGDKSVLQASIQAQGGGEDSSPLFEQTIQGSIVCRPPSLWHHSLWIDVGSSTNHRIGSEVIAKNSIVLADGALIGVIDVVGRSLSRVMLLTNPKFHPAVRVARGDANRLHQLSLANRLCSSLKDSDTAPHIQKLLTEFITQPESEEGTLYLAKGTLEGAADSSWRTGGRLLKGNGFNYDFPDNYGPSRDLRTGHTLPHDGTALIPLLVPGDLLVTSGLDGILPSGLPVATIKTIYPLKEGDFVYSLLATPAAGNLSALQFVTILPPRTAIPITTNE